MAAEAGEEAAALMLQADRAMAVAEYARATWQQRIDEQRWREKRAQEAAGAAMAAGGGRKKNPNYSDNALYLRNPEVRREQERHVEDVKPAITADRSRDRDGSMQGKGKEGVVAGETRRVKSEGGNMFVSDASRLPLASDGSVRDSKVGPGFGLSEDREVQEELHNVHTVGQTLIGKSSGGKKYNAAEAEEAFKAGVAAKEEGDAPRAVAHFQEAAAKCPPERQAALQKIEMHIADALKTSKAKDERAEGFANGKVQALKTLLEESQNCHFQKKDLSPEMTSAERNLEASRAADVMTEEVTKGSLPNARAADASYRAGVEALEQGDPRTALGHLKAAAMSCPPEKRVAAAKIEKLMREAIAELKQ